MYYIFIQTVIFVNYVILVSCKNSNQLMNYHWNANANSINQFDDNSNRNRVSRHLLCPSPCVCSESVLDCTDSNLDTVPNNIPQKISRINLSGNQIEVIRRKDFIGLNNLRVLQLSRNKIHTIESGAFNELSRLQRIRLNQNQLRSLPDFLLDNLLDLARLDLSENYFTVLTGKMLQGTIKLKNLQLDRNHLSCIDFDYIRNQKDLEIINLNHNNFTSLGSNLFSNMRNLRILRIADNPLICDCRLKWFNIWLNSQSDHSLAANTKCYLPNSNRKHLVSVMDSISFICPTGTFVPDGEKCDSVRVCPARCICIESYGVRNQPKYTVYCTSKSLVQVPPLLPLNTTELRLDQNKIPQILVQHFKGLQKLISLDLSSNQIDYIEENSFLDLINLKTLVIYQNEITQISAPILNGLSGLRYFMINQNKVECVKLDSFHGMPDLELLSLYSNRIRSMVNGTLAYLPKLKTLHLGQNELICDCNLKWLGERIEHERQKGNHNFERTMVECAAPPRLYHKPLSNIRVNEYVCEGSEEYVTKYSDQCLIDINCPSKCQCHGTMVDCSAKDLDYIPAIPNFATELKLNDNKLLSINADVFNRSRNLRKLHLQNNFIADLDDGVFSGLLNLEELDISHNRFQILKPSVFGSLKSLRKLNISNNRIRCLSPDVFVNLDTFDQLSLDNNNFVCDCHLSWLINWIRQKPEILQNETFCSFPSALRRIPFQNLLPKQLVCDDDTYSSVDASCMPGGRFCPTSCKCDKTVVQCSMKKLASFPAGIPTDTTELYLDNNDIDEIPDDLNKLVFLEKLDLSGNRLHVIPSNTFIAQSKLKILILSENKLHCIEQNAFEGLHDLKILSIHGNEVSVLPESAFYDLRNLSQIGIGSNPLYCDCKMQWFSHWISDKNLESGVGRCQGPQALRNRVLLTTPLDRFECNADIPDNVKAKCNMCINIPCKNDGVCSPEAGRTFKCHCLPGYYGDTCQKAIDACFGTPCLNGATCKVKDDQAGQFSCICAKGFEGDRCQTNIDDCLGHECLNGASCEDLIADYACKCPPQFTGWDCGKAMEVCLARDNPCRNGATCNNRGNHYFCDCAPGYEGRDCSKNIDDCKNNLCQENTKECVDHLNGYECRCKPGFTGQYCEIKRATYTYYPADSPCHYHNCSNQFCKVGVNGDPECVCNKGYGGSACEKWEQISFFHQESYAAIEPPDFTNEVNLTFILVTTKQKGVLLYVGDENAFLSVEIFRRRIKVGFFVGNTQQSQMYSYDEVVDGKRHKVTLIISGRVVSIITDDNQSQTVANPPGNNNWLRVRNGHALYVGGIPRTLQPDILEGFRLSDTASLNGCIENLLVNGEKTDFNRILKKNKFEVGCTLDVCHDNQCQQGKCMISNNSRNRGNIQRRRNSLPYRCKCKEGFRGRFCEKKRKRCHKKRFIDFHREANCRSRRKIKNATCRGPCNQKCCTPSRVKRKRVRMLCSDKPSYIIVVNIIRKCSCKPNCDALPIYV